MIYRKSKEQFDKFSMKKRAQKFVLVEQKDFNGSKELLESMQDAERCYREGKPKITDEEWDELVRKTGYEESLDNVYSPSGRKWHTLSAPLVSLPVYSNIEKLKDFLNKFPKDQEFIVEPKLDGLTFDAVYKEEDNFSLSCITSRNDGINGLCMWDDALIGTDVFGLPDSLSEETIDYLRKNNCVVDGRVEIRGEAVIDKDIYSKVGKNGNYEDIVPRSIAAGIFNRKIPNNLNYIESLFEENVSWGNMTKEQRKLLGKYQIVKTPYKKNKSPFNEAKICNGELYVKKDDDYISYRDSGYENELVRNYESIHFITFSIASKDGNIDNPALFNNDNIPGIIYVADVEDFEKIFKTTSDIEEIISSIDYVYGTTQFKRDLGKTKYKNIMKFAVDGVVIKPVGSNTETQKLIPRKKAGKTIIPHYPADQIAVKLPNIKVKTKILKIEQNKTDLGNIACKAIIESVKVEGGAVISNVNLYNPLWMQKPENQWIKEGVECYVYMSRDVQPMLSEKGD